MAAVRKKRNFSTHEVANYLRVEDNFGGRSSRVLTSISFSNLPCELQLQIFSFLSHEELCKSVALVCKQWWRLSQDPSLWKSLTIFFYSLYDKTKFLRLLERRSGMLEKLKIRTTFSLNDFASHAFPMLKCLDLGKVNLDSEVVCMFVKNCPLIEELNLKRCDVDKESVWAIVLLKNLRVLNLSSCSDLNDDLIQLIAEKCTHLEDLNIYAAGLEITDKAISKVIDNLHSTLTRFTLGGYDITDSAFAKISLCTKLQHLSINLYNCHLPGLTDKALIYFKMLLGWKSLTLNDHHSTHFSLTTIGVNNFFTGPHVNSLEKLELGDICINDDGVYNITQNCKVLKSLFLDECSEITEVGFEHIVKNCSNLTYLHLSKLNQPTGLCLQLIPEKLSSLEFLTFYYCNGIVKSVVNDLAIRVPKLKIKFQ